MPGQIDLHMHSTASDGTDTPLQLAEKVKAAGIKAFALTDHDTVAGAEELLNHLPEGVAFIPGIEFSCRMDTGKCHILGYHCDTAHPAFQAALRQGADLRKRKLDQRLEFLRGRGVTFPSEELDGLRRLPSAGKPHLGNLMVRYGYAASLTEAIREVLDLCPSSSSRIPAETAVEAILASGGVPVWAHPLGGEGDKETGLEQFTAMLDEIAQEHGLFISGGSDYHGTNKSIALGTLNADGQDVSREWITIWNDLMKWRAHDDTTDRSHP